VRPHLRSGIVALAAFLTCAFGFASAAQATDDKPSFATCDNLNGWYANPDEQEDLPTPTEAGLLFEGKDLIHHQTSPLALADVKTGGTFEATNAGKVVFKMETTNPYSTIIQNQDGKFWSSRLAVDAPGGQNKPVSVVTDMIGSETKTGNPKYTNDTHVVTFGVGYWVAEGDTVVSSISFHGNKYPLTCKPKPTSAPTTSASTSPPTSKPTTSSPTATKPTTLAPTTNSPAPGFIVGSAVGGAVSGPSLPVTGPSIGVVAAVGAAVLALGGALLVLTRRRKAAFSAE
jgi:LPXTG-motif cell wall-anchored protein